MQRERTQVAIVGAGPAGLLLGRLLQRTGIEAVILETRDREYVEARIRAGVLEQGTVDVLGEVGLDARLRREGLRHGGIHLAFDGVRHHIAMDELAGGRSVTVYGQTEVVRDLIAARIEDGLALRSECEDVTPTRLHDDEPAIVRYRDDDGEHELHADVVAGCDGFHGVCRATVADALTVDEREYPYAWLGILADAAPATDELIYAHHPRGFALYSMRSPSVSRLYLQVAPDARTADWSTDRIWSELHERLDTDDGLRVAEGPVTDVSVTPMRASVAAPMSHGRLHLAGDAAHIVPPTGAKGLNLAVADVTVLARALAAHLRDGDEAPLRAYSERCLRRVWRAQQFSWWMTTMLHVDPDGDRYGAELALSQLRHVAASRAQAMVLAENYVGLPLDDAPVSEPELVGG